MFQFFSKWIVKMLRPLTSRTQCRAVFNFFSYLLAIGALYTSFKCGAVEWLIFSCDVSCHVMHTVRCSLSVVNIFPMNF